MDFDGMNPINEVDPRIRLECYRYADRILASKLMIREGLTIHEC